MGPTFTATTMSEPPTSMHRGETPGSTSSSLLERLRARDHEAWRRLTLLYGPLVYGWGRQRGLRPEDAADVTQEVLAAVAVKIGDFRLDGAKATFRGWLWTITRNKIHDLYRRQAGKPQAQGGSDAQDRLQKVAASDGFEPSDPTAIVWLVRQALELIRIEFEERTWQAFWRTAVDGQRTADVAVELDMNPAAIRKARSRVFQRLRAELGDAMP